MRLFKGDAVAKARTQAEATLGTLDSALSKRSSMGFQETDKWSRLQKYLRIKEHGPAISMLLEIIGELEDRIAKLESQNRDTRGNKS